MSRVPSADEASMLTVTQRLFKALGDETVYSFYAMRALSRRCTYRLKLSKPSLFQNGKSSLTNLPIAVSFRRTLAADPDAKTEPPPADRTTLDPGKIHHERQDAMLISISPVGECIDIELSPAIFFPSYTTPFWSLFLEFPEGVVVATPSDKKL